MFKKVFSRFSGAVRNVTKHLFWNGYSPVFTPFGDNTYESDVVRSTVDVIARNAAKIKFKHVRRVNGKIQNTGSVLERMINTRPNPKENGYIFLYKVFTQLLLRSNAFILIDRGNAMERYRIKGLYPVDCVRAEMMETQSETFIQFHTRQGETYTVPYEDVIHLRRFYYSDSDFGSSNEAPLLPTLELIHTTNQGIINAVKSSAFVRGILTFTTSLRPEDMKEQKEQFVKDYLSADNNGGIAATDSKSEFKPINNDPKMIDSKQMTLIEQKVYKYFGANEKIINSSYSEDEWNSFYESVIEPLAIQLSLEMTGKCFSENEINHGNELVCESNRLQYASIKTKLELVQMVDRGAMTPNQWLEVFNMSPIEGGDKPIRRLDTAEVNVQPVKQKPDTTLKGGEEEDDEENDE